MKSLLQTLLVAAAVVLVAGCDKEIREARIPDRGGVQHQQLYNAKGHEIESSAPTAEELAHGPWEYL